MLMTARADRGPQWDLGTQQYVCSVCGVVHLFTPLQIPSGRAF